MDKRKALKNGHKIELCEQNNENNRRVCEIIKLVSDSGASAICYEAKLGGKRGILKEFYPSNGYGLERNKEGHLIPSAGFPDACRRFREAEQEYIRPFQMMFDERRNENPILSTFIPPFEIYRSCDKDGTAIGTTYIWTPTPKLELFSDICADIHNHPRANPEYKLATVLSAIDSLTKCICELHIAEMIHRDIKPENFGFLNRRNETLTQTLSMFDIDSVCPANKEPETKVWTDGYAEPDRGKPLSNQVDIYSIGATLFHAIIVTDETKENGYLYKEEWHDRLSELVDTSRLISASEHNSHPKLKNSLSTILRKCLCKRRDRYSSCEELLKDLEVALYYALPSAIAKKVHSGERWTLRDAEKSLDKNSEKNSSLSIQYHMFEHPLHQHSDMAEETLNVLVIGLGNYGQKFLDVCLQSGQIRGKQLCVTVISDDASDKDIYLSSRPELANFFNIDGSLKDREDSYGDIAFVTTKLERDNQATNADVLRRIMREQCGDKHMHYIFVALGEDALNYSAALACQSILQETSTPCTVSYVCENDHSPKKRPAELCPLYVNRDVTKAPLYADVERMAFNTHLIWQKNLNIESKKIREDYLKPENHFSSIANVLSIKSKFYSMGIDLVDLTDAASRFSEMLSDEHYSKLRTELIWIEHRRWVTQKLCLGWRSMPVDKCKDGQNQDKRHKMHTCIVRSHPDQKLAEEYNVNGDYSKWDTATKKDLSQLDDLDRMSVELHRVFARNAKAAKDRNLLSGGPVVEIKNLVEADKQSLTAFQEWFSCLKDIWNGDMEKARQYKALTESLQEKTENLPSETKNSVSKLLKAFDTSFRPILASVQYTDWKQTDADLIDGIPFVLTYTDKAHLVIPFTAGNNNSVFGNVSAPSMVNPGRITYIHLIEKAQDISELLSAIPCVVQYMGKKNLKASVDFILASYGTSTSLIDKKLEEEIIHRGGGRIQRVKSILCDRAESLSAAIAKFFTQRNQSFAMEKNASPFSYLLQGAGFYNSFDSYRFDSRSMTFSEINGCPMLKYISKKPFITAADMTAFNRSSSISSNQPEFFGDFRELWNKYRENSNLWKHLCDILGEHSLKNDTLASFKKKSLKEKAEEALEYRYILPLNCKKCADRIIKNLQEHRILEENSCVNVFASDSCEIVIADRCDYRAEYDKLFSNVYALMMGDAISIHLNTKSHKIVVSFDDLTVKDVPISRNKCDDIQKLMTFFLKKGYVIALSLDPDDGKMSFTYATRKIKELLTTAGKILEIYTYHKAKELGKFDDVASGFEIDWENTDVKSEFDCILTKGFQTLFVECKARNDIEAEFYFKLSSLVNHFGINATAVLIADTQEKSYYDNAPINTMQRVRGSMMNVVTIWDPKEIDNIGETLWKIVSGTYSNNK